MNDFNSAASLDGAELPIGTTAIGWSATDLNGNSANCSQTITVNYIESYQHVTDNGKVELFPNPTAGEITIILQENSELFVMSITGKMVMRETLSPGEHIFDLKDNGKGLYLLRIIGESYTFTDKIIIE